MYKLLIVEDEEIFRGVLPIIIDWNSIGFEIIAVVDNGYKALEFLDKSEVDAILTDIRMPVLNGLELAMEVKARFPKIKVTLFSAFNEFNYARKGIECGVYGYILKSDGEDEIINHFTKLKIVLDEEKQKDKERKDIWKERELLFKKLQESPAKPYEKILADKQREELLSKFTNSHITLFQLDEYKYLTYYLGVDKVLGINYFIRNYLYENIEMKNKGIVIHLNDLVCVLWNVPEKAFMQLLEEIFIGLKEELEILEKNDEECLDISCVNGFTLGNLEEFINSYKNAQKAFIQKTYIGNRIIDCGELYNENKRVFTFTEEERQLKEILPLLHNKEHYKLIEYLEKLKDDFIASKFTDIDMISGFAVKLVLTVINDMGKMGLKSDTILMKSNYVIKEIGYCETIRLIFKKLEAFFIEVFGCLNEENYVQNRKVVDEAMKYIKSNYASQISLEEVARHVNVHPVHLSRLFSKDLGETFKHILIEARIEEAKKLLKDINYRVYEISSLVGYEKPRYFSELFRSITGLTPLKYREKYKE